MGTTQPYQIFEIDLTVATGSTPREIVPRAKQISSITVLTFVPGTTFSMHMGKGGGVPITIEGTEFHSDDPCTPITDDGVFAVFPAQPGTTVRLFVSFGTTRARGV